MKPQEFIVFYIGLCMLNFLFPQTQLSTASSIINLLKTVSKRIITTFKKDPSHTLQQTLRTRPLTLLRLKENTEDLTYHSPSM